MTTAFPLPIDVLKRLGAGDAAFGLAALSDAFGLYPLVGPSGAIPAEIVKEIGHGDIAKGRRVLQKLVSVIRRGRSDRGDNVTSKTKGSTLIIRTKRADVGISIDHE